MSDINTADSEVVMGIDYYTLTGVLKPGSTFDPLTGELSKEQLTPFETWGFNDLTQDQLNACFDEQGNLLKSHARLFKKLCLSTRVKIPEFGSDSDLSDYEDIEIMIQETKSYVSDLTGCDINKLMLQPNVMSMLKNAGIIDQYDYDVWVTTLLICQAAGFINPENQYLQGIDLDVPTEIRIYKLTCFYLYNKCKINSINEHVADLCAVCMTLLDNGKLVKTHADIINMSRFHKLKIMSYYQMGEVPNTYTLTNMLKYQFKHRKLMCTIKLILFILSTKTILDIFGDFGWYYYLSIASISYLFVGLGIGIDSVIFHLCRLRLNRKLLRGSNRCYSRYLYISKYLSPDPNGDILLSVSKLNNILHIEYSLSTDQTVLGKFKFCENPSEREYIYENVGYNLWCFLSGSIQIDNNGLINSFCNYSNFDSPEFYLKDYQFCPYKNLKSKKDFDFCLSLCLIKYTGYTSLEQIQAFCPIHQYNAMASCSRYMMLIFGIKYRGLINKRFSNLHHKFEEYFYEVGKECVATKITNSNPLTTNHTGREAETQPVILKNMCKGVQKSSHHVEMKYLSDHKMKIEEVPLNTVVEPSGLNRFQIDLETLNFRKYYKHKIKTETPPPRAKKTLFDTATNGFVRRKQYMKPKHYHELIVSYKKSMLKCLRNLKVSEKGKRIACSRLKIKELTTDFSRFYSPTIGADDHPVTLISALYTLTKFVQNRKIVDQSLLLTRIAICKDMKKYISVNRINPDYRSIIGKLLTS